VTLDRLPVRHCWLVRERLIALPHGCNGWGNRGCPFTSRRVARAGHPTAAERYTPVQDLPWSFVLACLSEVIGERETHEVRRAPVRRRFVRSELASRRASFVTPGVDLSKRQPVV
jgi:hypothetical protein